MNVLIARSAQDCENWDGIAVVIDVLRTSATVCALLGQAQRTVLVCSEETAAKQITSVRAGFAVFSEEKLEITHEDNSPYLAHKLEPSVPAVVVSKEVGEAVKALSTASAVLLGGFCNFEVLANLLAVQEQDVLLVPASFFSPQEQEEDTLCASALKDFMHGAVAPEKTLAQLANTVRLAEFKKQGLPTAQKDLKLVLSINSLPVIPRAVYAKEGDWSVCVSYESEPEEFWFTPQASRPVPVQVPQEPENPAPPKAPAPADSEPSVPSQQKPATRTKKPSRLKGFLSDIVRSVKEEKAELEQTFRQAVGTARKTSSSRPDDPLDTILKQASQAEAQASAATQEETPISSAAEEPDVQKSPAPVLKEGNGKKAIVLFSGGLDSTTCLYWAIAEGYTCYALTVSYGQRHLREVVSAQAIARKLGVPHQVIDLNLPWLAASSLVDENQALPDIEVEKIPHAGIPSTYVPGRNLMFLSIAGSWLDVLKADAIIAGPNAVDFSGYPDCTPGFYKAAGEALNRGTERGVKEGIEVLAPLMRLGKGEIVTLANQLKVPFELTWSCYAGGEKPCGHCDSCKLRAKGFKEAGIHDPALD